MDNQIRDLLNAAKILADYNRNTVLSYLISMAMIEVGQKAVVDSAVSAASKKAA